MENKIEIAVEVIKVEHIANTLVAVTLRCCGDESTDSVHTFEVSGEHTEADLQAWLDSRHAHVRGQYHKREAAKDFFIKMSTSTQKS
jgi:hypothetical protein